MFIEQPAKWLRWLYPKAIWRMDKNDHSVYLTFDDGPIPESTPFILETLRKYNIKATFFMVGENVLRNHDLYNQIVAEGHQIGNHTFNHIGAFKHRVISYVLNTNKANDIIHAHLFRPPHGWMRQSEYWWLHRTYKVIMWDVVTRDYSKWMTAEDVVNNVKKYARNGLICFLCSLCSYVLAVSGKHERYIFCPYVSRVSGCQTMDPVPVHYRITALSFPTKKR